MSETVARNSGSLERELLSIVVGLIAAVLVIISLEPVLQKLYPVLQLNPLDASAQGGRAVDSLPAASLLLLLVAYALASFVGGLASSLTAGKAKALPAVVTGLVLMIAGSYGVMVVYQPLWFRAASFLTYPMAYVGYLVTRKSA